MEYQDYNNVPLHRKSATNSWLLLFGLFFPPFIWFVAIMLVTGDIYFNKKRGDGNLKKWSLANKVVALIIVIGQLFAIIGWLL